MTTETFTHYSGTQITLSSNTARTASFSEIPLISLSTPQSELIASLRDACTRVGFFYIKDHEVPTDVIDNVFAAAEEFFAQPEDVKMKWCNRNNKSLLGYEPLAKSMFEKGKKPDLHEAFAWKWEEALDPEFREDADDQAADIETPMSAPNQWPSTPSSFKPSIAAYYGTILALARRMTRLFALALNLPETFFDDKFSSRPGIMGTVLHYPPQPPSDPNRIGIGAHTDFECFTILYQMPNRPGLQVLNTAGEWILAPPIPGTFVVNIGDMLARWSNDVFRSTVHRVLNTTGLERYSLPVFCGPRYDAVVEPLESCVGIGEGRNGEKRYGPITAGEYVFQRLAESRYGKEEEDDTKEL